MIGDLILRKNFLIGSFIFRFYIKTTQYFFSFSKMESLLLADEFAKHTKTLQENIFWKEQVLELYKLLDEKIQREERSRPIMRSIGTQTEETMNTINRIEGGSIAPRHILFPQSPQVSGENVPLIELVNPRHRRAHAVSDYFEGPDDFYEWLLQEDQ